MKLNAALFLGIAICLMPLKDASAYFAYGNLVQVVYSGDASGGVEVITDLGAPPPVEGPLGQRTYLPAGAALSDYSASLFKLGGGGDMWFATSTLNIGADPVDGSADFFGNTTRFREYLNYFSGQQGGAGQIQGQTDYSQYVFSDFKLVLAESYFMSMNDGYANGTLAGLLGSGYAEAPLAGLGSASVRLEMWRWNFAEKVVHEGIVTLSAGNDSGLTYIEAAYTPDPPHVIPLPGSVFLLFFGGSALIGIRRKINRQIMEA